ncbi:MAG: hypothetical protein JTT13_09700 [Candidatus Brockarchaeota archaeon]|nr:hypothetical protein [Candidatus Brockarchaeota archaeon]
MSYLENEPFWVKIEVKGRTLYKKYDSSTRYFNPPMDIGKETYLSKVIQRVDEPFLELRIYRSIVI